MAALIENDFLMFDNSNMRSMHLRSIPRCVTILGKNPRAEWELVFARGFMNNLGYRLFTWWGDIARGRVKTQLTYQLNDLRALPCEVGIIGEWRPQRYGRLFTEQFTRRNMPISGLLRRFSLTRKRRDE